MTDSKTKKLTLTIGTHGWGERTSHSVSDPDTGEGLYWVIDLACDCPEDATLARDIPDAYEWLEGVRYGMELAKQGFDSVEFEVVEDDR